MKNDLLKNAVRNALLASAAAALVLPVAYAAEDDQEEDRITVVGSRIKQIDIEGASPVITIDREDIEKSGKNSVADVLRSNNLNSFGSFREQSGTSFSGQAQVDLRGLGAGRTKVLLNGNDLPRSPVAGNSAPNLNIIPLAAVERIEILSDGASAIYGSDAIGGVINIITRQDYSGGEFTGSVFRPTQDGGDVNAASFVLGTGGDRGQVMFSTEYREKDIIFDRDRPYTAADLGDGTTFGTTTGVSEFGNTIIRIGVPTEPGGPAGGRDATPTCPTDLYAGIYNTSRGTACAFAYANVSANTQSLKRFSTFLDASYEITDNITLSYQNFLSATENFGRYAPAVGGFFISGDAPTNPFPGVPFVLGHRFAALGNRDDTTREDVIDNAFALSGSAESFDWEVGLRNNKYKANSNGQNYVIQSIAEDLVASGAYDPFNALDPSNAGALAAFRATLTRDIESDYTGGHAFVTFPYLSTSAGDVQWVAGVDYRDEDYKDIYDSLREAGNVIGSAGNSAGGARAQYAAYFESQIPILDSLEANVAGRFDHYNDFGDNFSPKVSFRYQPTEDWLLRFSWGEGFRAPNLNDLYSAVGSSFLNGVDTVFCDDPANGGNGNGSPDETFCETFQYETVSGGNPNLNAEESTQYNLGVVYNPTNDLRVALDLYEVELTNVIQTIGPQFLINLQLAGASLPAGTAINRLAGGDIDTIDSITSNIARRETSGANLGVSYTRGSIALGWARGDHSVNYDMQYIRSQDNVQSHALNNIQYAYESPWDATLRLGILNMFDRDPSFVGDSNTYDDALYSVDGRVPYVSISKRF